MLYLAKNENISSNVSKFAICYPPSLWDIYDMERSFQDSWPNYGELVVTQQERKTWEKGETDDMIGPRKGTGGW